MSYIKTILVCLTDHETGLIPLKAAYKIGQVFNSHIEALHVRLDPVCAVPYAGEGVSGAMVAEMMKISEKEADECSTKTRQMFDEFCKKNDVLLLDEPSGVDTVSGHWHEEIGVEEDIVSRLARVNGLIVLGRSRADEDSSLMTFDATIFDGGRSVLIVPEVLPEKIGSRVAILWNGSSETSRAVSAAKPFLMKADAVTIFVTKDAEDDLTDAESFKKQLAWNDIKANVQILPVEDSSVGDGILEVVEKDNYDLLVMGAYTQNRVRRLFFGGVTKQVIGVSAIPILMSH